MSQLSRDPQLRIGGVLSHEVVEQGLPSKAEVRLRAPHIKTLRLPRLVRRIRVIILVDVS